MFARSALTPPSFVAQPRQDRRRLGWRRRRSEVDKCGAGGNGGKSWTAGSYGEHDEPHASPPLAGLTQNGWLRSPQSFVPELFFVRWENHDRSPAPPEDGLSNRAEEFL